MMRHCSMFSIAPAPTGRVACIGLLAVLFSCAPPADTDAPASEVQSSAQPHLRVQPENYKPTPSPLSPGVLVGNTLYLSGSTGGDPETGQLVEGGFEPEFRQVMSNLNRVLEAADMDLGNVVQVTTYLADMEYYARYNEMYREYFTVEPLPARATVAVKQLARGALVEVMMIAVR